MKSKVVYLTSDQAQIITLKVGDYDTETLKPHGPKHHAETLGRNHEKKSDDVEKFMHEVAERLESEQAKVLIVGPAQAKLRLKSHIEREHPKLAKLVVGIEGMDKQTTPQVVDFARKFFTKLGAFESI